MKVNTNQKFTAVPADAKLPTKYGEFRIRSYVDPTDGSEHAAIYLGDMNNQSPPLVRIHWNVLLRRFWKSPLRLWPTTSASPEKPFKKKAEELSSISVRKAGELACLQNAAYNLQDRGLDTLDANLALDLPADGRTTP